MSLKITDKILSIPPYISTSWSRVTTLHIKGDVLAVNLVDGDTLHIPDLPTETLHLIFKHHAQYLENEQVAPMTSLPEISKLKNLINQEDPSIQFAFGTPIEGMAGGNVMEHNPDQADSPELPPEVLEKIGTIAKILTPSLDFMLPQGEASCNCFYCQIARAFKPTTSFSVIEEPIVADDRLNFQQIWSISQTGDQLYSVVHRLNENEKYNVYLGQPVGCTCGKEGCEHILAVLRS